MTVLVSLETTALLLLGVLVAGLLRSHAETLRQLRLIGENGIPTDRPERPGIAPAVDVAGRTPGGEARSVGMGIGSPPTLLAFLTTGCLTCQDLWEELRDGGGPAIIADTRLIVVTKDAEHESLAKVKRFSPRDIPVVMSSASWEAYSVPGSPYFIYVAGGQVRGEGSASQWTQVRSLLEDALADDAAIAEDGRGLPAVEAIGVGTALDDRRSTRHRTRTNRERVDRIDSELAAAGIHPEHPSLYSSDMQEASEDATEG